MPMPRRMRTGERPSGPPPRGKMVVLRAVRILIGAEGKRRRAGLRGVVGVRCGLESWVIGGVTDFHRGRI